ncbi:DUF885 family protein [Rhizobium sp. BK251]|uniref:DUF885 family protein n=1 Tax=Rhizobium sp. BK251 TaxID=2512125 RepID=UPI0010486529|nr:DUF885 family protein [Rhizobium sp. BK251]TCL62937.1 uncharacterized protein (DUF885 family) [Rhizobium sp. BK251]
MTSTYDPAFVDLFLSHYWTYHPVDATFMGNRDNDGRLPPVDGDVLEAELSANARLVERIAATAEPATSGDRLDRKMMLSELEMQAEAARHRPRLHNPAWYTGEAAFGIISLLLPQAEAVRHEALLDRLEAVPAFLQAAAENLAGRPVPKSWVARAQRECHAMLSFLRDDIRLHDQYRETWRAPAGLAADAFSAFAEALKDCPDADPACGEAYMARLMKVAHGLDLSPRQAVDLAQHGFDDLEVELQAMAKQFDPARSWEEIVASLSNIHPQNEDAVFASYRDWDDRARRDGRKLVTPADDYQLDYRWMALCFRNVSKYLYFLFYRSPPGLSAGEGSVYWVTPPGEDLAPFLSTNSTATVKAIHSVHHGSIGHHTQNARARQAASRLARIAGTDCAMGLAFLGSGTLIEGWACYAEDLLMEAPGFYMAEELLLLKHFERRNAASVLVDIKLHIGDWSMDEAIAFYRDKAGFAPARVEGEVVRNSMLPGSRLMYWLGVEGIRALRKRWKGDARSFHDTLLSFGHMPLAWIGEEMDRAGLLAP